MNPLMEIRFIESSEMHREDTGSLGDIVVTNGTEYVNVSEAERRINTHPDLLAALVQCHKALQHWGDTAPRGITGTERGMVNDPVRLAATLAAHDAILAATTPTTQGDT